MPVDDIFQDTSIFVFTVSGVKMGADTGQILEMFDMRAAESHGRHIKKLNELVSFGKKDISFNRPKIIRLKSAAMPLIVIEEPESILDIKINDIRPMPAVIEKRCSKALWGAVLSGSGMILLVDFYKLNFRNTGGI